MNNQVRTEWTYLCQVAQQNEATEYDDRLELQSLPNKLEETGVSICIARSCLNGSRRAETWFFLSKSISRKSMSYQAYLSSWYSYSVIKPLCGEFFLYLYGVFVFFWSDEIPLSRENVTGCVRLSLFVSNLYIISCSSPFMTNIIKKIEFSMASTWSTIVFTP